MNKEIKYNGYSAQPSDYECQDGDLSVCLNLIQENEALHPLSPPVVMIKLSNDQSVIFVHKTSSYTHYIIKDKNGLLYWLDSNDINADSKQPVFKHSNFGSVSDFKNINAVGNTLILIDRNGISYYLWSNGNYRFVGYRNRPPFVAISFSLSQMTSAADTSDIIIPATTFDARGASETDLANLTQAIYAQMLPEFVSKFTEKGYFYQPFMVRYAFRLYDGSYIWHSSPVLMLPTIFPPRSHGSKPRDAGNGNIYIESSFAEIGYALDYSIPQSPTLKALSGWEDIIVGIDIFVSAPIYTFDQSKDMKYGSRTPAAINNEVIRAIDSGVGDINLTSRSNGGVSVDDGPHYWSLPLNENFVNDIRDVHVFYHIATLEYSDIKACDSQHLKLKTTDLSALVTFPQLPDDFNSHAEIYPTDTFLFNSRLNIAGLGISPAPPLPFTSLKEMSNNTDNINSADPYYVYAVVWSRINGIKGYNFSYRQDLSGSVKFPELNFPRYIYHPDPNAYKIEFVFYKNGKGSGEGYKTITIDLKPHDFLNGSYYLGSLTAEHNWPTSALSDSMDWLLDEKTIIPVNNKIYTSEVNNPYLFPLEGINTVGTGEVIGMATATKALSEGQFGQFPLYAFTTEGVWALEVSPTGTYMARQPVTRDVCINPDGITQLDSAVLFPTDRGIMLISGSQTQCISEAINSEYPFNALELPSFNRLHDLLGHEFNDKCLPTLPFTEFLKQCRMIYDYVHQHVIVYAPGISYAYVFSLRSKLWGMMLLSITSHLNSYPDALAVDNGNNIVSFSNSDNTTVKCLYVTRPLKLDTINTHKTIDNVVQRGYFRKGKVGTVLYGSRDMVNWHLIWSSKDHFLRGFSGTPYKYFRIAGIANLDADESIFGASVRFTLRITNQPR